MDENEKFIDLSPFIKDITWPRAVEPDDSAIFQNQRSITISGYWSTGTYSCPLCAARFEIPVAKPTPFSRPTQPVVITRTFTTYSAYEDPIAAE